MFLYVVTIHRIGYKVNGTEGRRFESVAGHFPQWLGTHSARLAQEAPLEAENSARFAQNACYSGSRIDYGRRGMSDRSKPTIPTDMKAFNAKVIAEFRANKGQLTGALANSRMLLLTTTGARSGRPRTTVVGYRRRGDDYVLIASNNGAPGSPAWFFNLKANPIATVEVGADRFESRARVATPEERPELTKVVEYLERQQTLTGRVIPIVVLERVG